MGIGANIRRLRKNAKMTQPELAEKLGVHETTIRRWEQEKDKGPDAGMINSISEIFHTSPESLLSSNFLSQNDYLEDDIDDKSSLVFEWGGGHKLKVPNTAETRKMFENLVMKSLGMSAASMY